MTQLELAERLGVQQPMISKLEQRNNPSLSLLREYVEAMGGELVVEVRFGRGPVFVYTEANQGASSSR